MSTDALIRNIAIPVGSVLLVAIVLSSERVQSTLLESWINVDNRFRWSETGDMRPYIQQEQEKEQEKEQEQRDSDYKTARGSFSEGGSKKTKRSKTKKR